jgi:hypothetical protein
LSEGWALAEHVAETLDIGPGTRVFEVDCGDGGFLVPLHANGYIVGGCDPDAAAIARAMAAMPDGVFQTVAASALDPAVPWHVVIWRRGAHDASPGVLAEDDHLRGVLARMFAKATHAIGVLDVADSRRQWMLHALTEIGAQAIQIENAPAGRFSVYARV